MQTNLHNTTINSVRRLSHNSLAFLALAVGTGLIVGALAFSLLSGQPASASAAATANTTVPAVSLTQERAEEHQWLAQRNASAVSLAKERAEEHQWLAQRSAAPYAAVSVIQRQEELKDQWLTRNITSLSPVQRQEELKDQWLERRLR